jgi:hypothetical protein
MCKHYSQEKNPIAQNWWQHWDSCPVTSPRKILLAKTKTHAYLKKKAKTLSPLYSQAKLPKKNDTVKVYKKKMSSQGTSYPKWISLPRFYADEDYIMAKGLIEEIDKVT